MNNNSKKEEDEDEEEEKRLETNTKLFEFGNFFENGHLGIAFFSSQLWVWKVPLLLAVPSFSISFFFPIFRLQKDKRFRRKRKKREKKEER